MYRLRLTTMALVLSLAALFPSTVSSTPEDPLSGSGVVLGPYPPGELVLASVDPAEGSAEAFRSLPFDGELVEEIVARRGREVVARVLVVWTPGDSSEIELEESDLAALEAGGVRALSRNAPTELLEPVEEFAVLEEEPGGPLRAAYTPSDPFLYAQHQHDQHNTREAWDIDTGRFATIAILDTGIDCLHPDLFVVRAFDATIGGGINVDHRTCTDRHGHATAVGGIAAGIGDNFVGITGTAYEAELVSVRVLSSGGSGSELWAARGIAWAIEQPDIDVLSMSFGAPTSSYSSVVCDLLATARDLGIVPVAATGNDGQKQYPTRPLYPAACGGVLGVGSVDRSGSPSDFTQRASGPTDYMVNGQDIVSTLRGGRYGSGGSGTSYSAPYVAGCVALIRSAYPSISVGEIERALGRTARDRGVPGWDPLYGWGIVNCGDAILFALLPETPTPGGPVWTPEISDTPPADEPTPTPIPTDTPTVGATHIPPVASQIASWTETAAALTPSATPRPSSSPSPTPTDTPSSTAPATPTPRPSSTPTLPPATATEAAIRTEVARIRTATAPTPTPAVDGTLRAVRETATAEALRTPINRVRATETEEAKIRIRYLPIAISFPAYPTWTPTPTATLSRNRIRETEAVGTETAIARGTETPSPFPSWTSTPTATPVPTWTPPWPLDRRPAR